MQGCIGVLMKYKEGVYLYSDYGELDYLGEGKALFGIR